MITRKQIRVIAAAKGLQAAHYHDQGATGGEGFCLGPSPMPKWMISKIRWMDMRVSLRQISEEFERPLAQVNRGLEGRRWPTLVRIANGPIPEARNAP